MKHSFNRLLEILGLAENDSRVCDLFSELEDQPIVTQSQEIKAFSMIRTGIAIVSIRSRIYSVFLHINTPQTKNGNVQNYDGELPWSIDHKDLKSSVYLKLKESPGQLEKVAGEYWFHTDDITVCFNFVGIDGVLSHVVAARRELPRGATPSLLSAHSNYHEYTVQALEVLSAARDQAVRLHSDLEARHVLHALFSNSELSIYKILHDIGADLVHLKSETHRLVHEEQTNRFETNKNDLDELIKLSKVQKKALGDVLIGPEHLFLACSAYRGTQEFFKNRLRSGKATFNRFAS